MDRALKLKDICCKWILGKWEMVFKNLQFWSRKEKASLVLKINFPLLQVKNNKTKQKPPYPCLSFLSTPVTEYHNQGNLWKKAFSWAYSFRHLESIMAAQRHGCGNIWGFTSWPKSRRQRESTVGRVHIFSKFKTCHKSYTSSNNDTAPTLSQTVSPTWDQEFKHKSASLIQTPTVLDAVSS